MQCTQPNAMNLNQAKTTVILQNKHRKSHLQRNIEFRAIIIRSIQLTYMQLYG